MGKDDLSKLLDEKLEGVATKDDLKQIRQEMATKKDLEALHRKLDFKLWLTEEKFDDKLDEKFREYTHRVTKGLDKVMRELEIIRQESTARQAHDERVDERLNRLEKHANLPLSA